jgi:ABC-type dipeptide/oligopeptide/nickel transport system ATPase component
MLVKLHGTSGSGKSTIARQLIALDPKPILQKNGKGKIESYYILIPHSIKPLYVLGDYSNQCGGMDGVSPTERQMDLIEDHAYRGHVFYEGLLGSEYYGKVGEYTLKFGDDHIFAFLDTPLDLCLERVQKRRDERGDFREFNPDNTIGRVKKIERLKYKLQHELFRRVETLNHLDPIPQILEWLNEPR